MANKILKIDLQFNANTKEAQRQMQQLQQSLSQLATSQPMTSFSLTPQLKEAQRSAMDLKIALNNAMNVDTGRLNLNKFQSELNRSGKSIQQYAQQLQALGPSGVRAFQQVAQAVAQADTKMFNLSGGAKKLMDTLGNTIRWQLTSSAIHGVMSAFSDTISYAKELDTSLNNIRIVTGKSADQMARFAKEANQMAKTLSTTTTKYSNASLIYYQQGLNEKEVKERTDVTVKLANVVGKNAEEVSEWMTSIWNNFDDGSVSLERYADMIAKLGAETASSADEIAEGLEKFAAVADTVGLSYEYATSALATVTAETRQSADVVGTAFKTLFARIEGLKFGETLEDGTDLNQYSLALEKVGVNIKDANGELKDMDTILDQTGARWQTLNKDQQIALAQQVAGIRQYNQFMALMDNWDVMQKNLALVEQSNGALNEQNRIYEESMQAAQERMKAASEELKALIIGGDDLIPLYNFAGGALEVITELLEAFGGLPTIILGVATALTKLYQPQIASFFSQAAVGLGSLKSAGSNFIHGKGFKADNTYQRNAVALGAQMADDVLPEGAKASYYAKENAAIEEKMIGLGDSVNQNVKQKLEWTFELIKKQQEYLLLLEQEIELQKQATGKKQDELQNQGMSLSTVSNLTSQATSLGQMKGYGKLAAQKVEQVANLGNLDQTSREAVRDDVKSSLTSMKKAATTGIAGEAGVGLDMADININLDGEMISVTDATRQAEQALDNYAKNGTEDLNSVLILIQKINEAMAEVGTDAIKANAENTLEAPTFGEMGQKYDNPNKPVGLAQIEKDLGDIDGRASLKEVKSSKKDEGSINKKSLKEQVNNIKKLEKEQSKYNKSSTEYTKLQKDIDKATIKLNRDMKKFIKTQDQNQKTNKKGIKLNEEMEQSVNELIEGAEKQGEAMAGSSDASEQLDDRINTLNEDLDNGGSRFVHWSDKVAGAMSAMAQMGMGVNMLTSSFSQLSESIANGEFTWSDLLSSMTSILFALPMLVNGYKTLGDQIGLTDKIQQLFTKSKKASKAATDAEIISTQAEIALAPADQAADQASAASENVETGAEIAGAAAGVAEQIGSGPPGWVTAAASIAMMAPLLLIAGGAMIGGIASGSAKGSKEAQEKEVSKGTESLEAINENQELAESVTDLTEEYNALRNAGESTADVLEDMKEKIPELIESYKELAKTMGTHIDTRELEKAYEVFQQTGDTTLLEKAQSEIDTQIKEAEKSTALTTSQSAKDLAIDAAREGDGRLKDDGTFVVRMGDGDSAQDKKGDSYMSEYLGDYWKDNNRIEFDTNNTAEVIDAYNKMIQARDAMQAAGDTDIDHYRELNREIEAMAESMPDLINAQQQLFEIEKEEALLQEEQFNQEIFGSIDDEITDTKSYAAARDELIQKLKEEKQWTEAQAEAYLAASDAYGKYESAHTFFDKEDGMANVQHITEEKLNEIKDWFANLPEEERSLAMTIDYTTVTNLDDAKEAMEEAREKARRAAIKEDAIKSGFKDSELEMYAQVLAGANSELKENSSLTDQVALNNLKLNKGLESLQKNWDKNLTTLREANKETPEYAAALAEVHDAIKEAFQVSVSAKFIEENLDMIGELARGNVEALDELQDKMAEDYILNLEIDNMTINPENAAVAIETGRQALLDMVNSIDTSLELGEGTTLSGDFLNTVQAMLDAGQITEQQLEEMMRAKGYELNITGWKTVPGPKKTITQKYKDWLGIERSKTIEETEMIQVPIINGDDTNISSGSVSGDGVEVIRSSTKDSVNFSQTNEGGEIGESKADRAKRLRDLDKELERYHEIREIIEDLTNEYDALAEAKDRAYGADKLELLSQSIKQTEKELQAVEREQREAEKWYDVDRKDLLSQYAVKLDSQGRISNYEELVRAELDILKQIEDPESKEYKDQKAYLDNMKEIFGQYEDSLNTLEETEQNIIDKKNKLADLAMEEIELKVQLKVDLEDDKLAYIEFMMQTIEDDSFAAAEAIGYLGQQTDIIKNKISATNNGISEVMAAINNQGYITDAQAEYLRDARGELIDYNSELEENRITVNDKLIEAYDAWNEKLDQNATTLEHISSIMENYKNIIDIVGKDTLGLSDDTMLKMAEAQIDNTNNLLKASKSKLEANEAYLEELKIKRAEAEKEYGKDSQQVKDWDMQIEHAQEEVNTATEDFMGNWENALTMAADAFASHVELIVENFSESMGGIYKNLEQLQEAFDRQKEINDRYLQTYEKTYEINKLNRQINQSIDKTDNLSSQKELRKLQKELLAMNEAGVEVSQRDIEYMQKKYDLMLAEQAFKDAQNAKTVVRLQRDSEGNFGYVYTADQGNVDNAEQNYEDKLYAMQQFGEESLLEIQDQILSTNTEFAEALRAISEDATLSLEEKKRKAAEITQYYTEKLGYWTAEGNKFMLHGKEINHQYNADMAETFNKTLLGQMYPDLTSFENYYTSAQTNMTKAGGDFTNALEGYETRIETVMGNAGTSVKTFEEDYIEEYLPKAQEESNLTAEAAEDLQSRMKAALISDSDSAIKSVEQFQTDYATKMKGVRDETQDTINKINELLGLYEEQKTPQSEDKKEEDKSGEGDYSNNPAYREVNIGGSSDTGYVITDAKTGAAYLWQGSTPILYDSPNDEILENSDIVQSNGKYYMRNPEEFTGYEDDDDDTYKRPASTSTPTPIVVETDPYPDSTYKKGQLVLLKNNGGLKAYTSYQNPSITNDLKVYNQGQQGSWELDSGTGVKIQEVAYNSEKENYWYKLKVKRTLNNGEQETKDIWIAGVQLQAMETGGYTGVWGPEGRLALLHQKEIVLNAHDTENFLAAIGIVRDISDQIEKNALVMQYQNQLANYRTSVGNSGDTLQQEVHIKAEFPNATNHSEIEEAFRNLTNLASQYANRKF